MMKFTSTYQVGQKLYSRITRIGTEVGRGTPVTIKAVLRYANGRGEAKYEVKTSGGFVVDMLESDLTSTKE